MSAAPMPIAGRIEHHLGRLDKTASWLADKAGVERSTITRILNGQRPNPSADTLELISSVFDVPLGEFVAGTDAEGRVAEDERMVPRRDFDGVMKQMLDFERRANDLQGIVRERDETIGSLQLRLRDVREEGDVLRRRSATAERERDLARRQAAHHEDDARRYREGLEKAVQDVAILKSQLEEMAKKVDDSRLAGRAAAVLAGLAAVVSVATYAGGGEANSHPKKKSTRRARAK